jgi:phage tail sheath gpL-like
VTGIPLAAPPTNPTPGFWLTVNLKPQNVTPGSQTLRGLILAPANETGGAATADTQVNKLLGLTDAETAAGQGSLASLLYQRLIARFPGAQIDLVCPTASGGASATGTFTFSGTITAAYTVRWKISGRIIDVPWNAGEDADTLKTRCITYIGRSVRDLFAAATSGGTGAVLFTAKGKGPAGNDITVTCTLIGGTGGVVTPSGLTSNKLTGGTTEPDFTTALATVSGIEYDFFGLGISNADAVSTTGNVVKTLAHINSLNSGPQSKLSQVVVGHTGLRTAVPAVTAVLNDQVAEIICAQNADDLPCEICGSEMGDRMNWRSLYYNYNRINNALPELYGSPNPVTDNPTMPAQSDAALLAGVSLLGYTQTGKVFVIRSVSTYTATPEGAQVLPTDCNEVDAIYEYAKDLRAAIPVEFAHARVIADLSDESQDEIPEGCVECRDILGFIVMRTQQFWVPKGVIDGAKFQASLDAKQLIVKINDVDATQVDIFIPASAVKNLAKFGVYMQKAS